MVHCLSLFAPARLDSANCHLLCHMLSAWQAGEKWGLDDRREWDDQPLAAVQFDIRIGRALCVGFFASHLVLL
jgi:hypothetical protein